MEDRGDGGGAGSEKRGRGRDVCVCVPSGSGDAPFILGLGLSNGVCSALLPSSMGEAQPGQRDLPGPRPG